MFHSLRVNSFDKIHRKDFLQRDTTFTRDLSSKTDEGYLRPRVSDL